MVVSSECGVGGQIELAFSRIEVRWHDGSGGRVSYHCDDNTYREIFFRWCLK
jgi:hypothetical protein